MGKKWVNSLFTKLHFPASAPVNNIYSMQKILEIKELTRLKNVLLEKECF